MAFLGYLVSKTSEKMKKMFFSISPYVKWFPRGGGGFLKSDPLFPKNNWNWIFIRFWWFWYQKLCFLMILKKIIIKKKVKKPNFDQKTLKIPKFWCFRNFLPFFFFFFSLSVKYVILRIFWYQHFENRIKTLYIMIFLFFYFWDILR